jgi:hypothetical protein
VSVSTCLVLYHTLPRCAVAVHCVTLSCAVLHHRYVGSSEGAVLGNGDSMTGGSELYSKGDFYSSKAAAAAGGRTSPLPTTAQQGAAAAAAAAAAASAGGAAAGPAKGSGKAVIEPSLYSGWPSLMRYSSSNTKLQGRTKRSSGSGLRSVSESTAGVTPRTATANLPA